MDDDVLGKGKPWQIRDFPEGLRLRIITAAREADQSVTDYVTAAMLRHLDGPDAGANLFANKSSQPDPAITQLAQLLTAAGGMGEHLPGEVRTLINALARKARGGSVTPRLRIAAAESGGGTR